MASFFKTFSPAKDAYKLDESMEHLSLPYLTFSPAKDASKLDESMEHLSLSYEKRIRPLLDAVDRLRHLNVMKEGIQLPTIVVVGDQSSGKSSVLESLAGISLPRGVGICTRVPLIMRLQNHQLDQPHLVLEYMGKALSLSEREIADAIVKATDEIAGKEKNISNSPLTLVVRKKGMPDLTMVDLPGITRVPVHSQPEDIYEQITSLIMEYIAPEESIILNVLSATVDFPTCESIRMSQRVDKTGGRTLAVVTKVDRAPEGLLEKVTADEVNIGLGYICVRNRVEDKESYAESRRKEAELFRSHPLLSKIDKSIVGIPTLANKLTQIQASIIAKCLPDIVAKVNRKLNDKMNELNELLKSITTVSEAMTALMRILSRSKESLKKLSLTGEYGEFPDDESMHCAGSLAEMLNSYLNELRSKYPDEGLLQSNFLKKEIRLLEESKGIWLPDFLPREAFLTLLHEKVTQISCAPIEFMKKVWGYLETVVLRVFMMHSNSYPQLQVSVKRAMQSIINKMRILSLERVKEIVDTETISDYTCNPQYRTTWTSLIGQQNKFMNVVKVSSSGERVMIDGYGEVNIAHLRALPSIIVEQAFDLKMRVVAYWNIVVLRLVDSVALHLIFSMQKLVKDELDAMIIDELVGSHMGGIDRMLKESPSTENKRNQLNNSIKLLREAKDSLSSIMDHIVLHNELEDRK